jgi:predicted nucleotidyltransferase
MKTAISLPQKQISDFCSRWHVAELSLFGSVLREDFHSQSDIDILVAFKPESNWGLLEHVQMQQELQGILGRDVDLVSKRAIERSSNWIRRQEILSTAQPIYAQP